MKAEQIAIIQEAECIGCARCIKACPVDAIIGAQNLLHHVLKEECIGCRLCLAPCPVDCIHMVDYVHEQPKPERTLIAKRRVRERKNRLSKLEDTLKLQSQQRKLAIQNSLSSASNAIEVREIKGSANKANLKYLEIQIQKAEKALQNAKPDQQVYARDILNKLYKKRDKLSI